jgi:hypothetical protein
MTKKDNARKSTNDLRNRLLDMHGKPLPQATALQGQKYTLERQLSERFEQQRSQNDQSHEDNKKILAPLFELIGKDKSAMSALSARQQRAQSNRQVKLKVPTFPKMESQVKSGSITTVVTPPYNYEWSTVSASHNSRGRLGGSHPSKAKGTFGIGFKVEDGSFSMSAGIGAYFRPLSIITYVRVSAFATYSYKWDDSAAIVTAHTDAFIGFYVLSFDLRGRNPHIEFDGRTSLWSDGVSGFDAHGDTNDGLLRNPQNEAIFLASSDRQYIIWVWANTSGDAKIQDTIFGTFASHSNSDLFVKVPFMVFQQL